MSVCCGKEILGNIYNFSTPVMQQNYNPNVDIFNKSKIPEILQDKYETKYLYKNHEYLATYIYNFKNKLDCYIISLLYNRLTEEEKTTHRINLNILITIIEDTKIFELVHNTINSTNVLNNQCKSNNGENILMMIFKNNGNKKCINSYIDLFIKSFIESCKTNDKINLTNIVNTMNLI